MDVIALWSLQLNVQLQFILNMYIKINVSFHFKKKKKKIFFLKLLKYFLCETKDFVVN